MTIESIRARKKVKINFLSCKSVSIKLKAVVQALRKLLNFTHLSVLISLLFSLGVDAAVTNVAMDSSGIPFFLDDSGNVWAFHKPFTLQDPYRLSNLKNIKKLVPYAAIDTNGKIFIWRIAPESKILGEGDIYTVYTNPIPLDSSSYSDVYFSGNKRWFAISKNQVVTWDIEGGTRVFGSGTFSKPSIFYDAKTVKSIGATDTASALLTIDGSTSTLGINPHGEASASLVESGWNTPMPSDSVEIYLNNFHLVTRNSSGDIFYWGGCRLDFLKENGYKNLPEPTYVKEAKGVISKVRKIVLSGNDNFDPDIFIKFDGSLWAALAPSPIGMNSNFCGSQTKSTMRNGIRIDGPKLPILDVAAGGSGSIGINIIAIDADHSVWISNFIHPSPMNPFEINFNPERK